MSNERDGINEIPTEIGVRKMYNGHCLDFVLLYGWM